MKQSPKARLAAMRSSMSAALSDEKTALRTALAMIIPGSGLLLLFPSSATIFILLISSLFLMNRANIKPALKVAIAAMVMFVAVPLAGQENYALVALCVQMFINICLALGLNLVVGFAGLLDLGYIAFFAGGAYVYAIFGSNQAALMLPNLAGLFPFGGWWFWVGIPVAILVAASLGIALGLPVLRLRGDYLAIVTLGFGEIIALLALNLDHPTNITNGARGITNITTPSVFGFKLDSVTAFYFIGLVLVILSAIVMIRIERSRTGRAWAAMREDEVAARAMGIQLIKYKLMAFATGAAFSGTAGVLYAMKQGFVNPSSFSFLESIGILAMVILGGLGSLEGAVVGAIAVTFIRLQLLKDLADFLNVNFSLPPAFNIPQYQPLIFGLILIVMMIYRRHGLIPERRPLENITVLEKVKLPASPTVHSLHGGGTVDG